MTLVRAQLSAVAALAWLTVSPAADAARRSPPPASKASPRARASSGAAKGTGARLGKSGVRLGGSAPRVVVHALIKEAKWARRAGDLSGAATWLTRIDRRAQPLGLLERFAL